MKGAGGIYRRTFVDTHARAAVRKLYTEKTAIADTRPVERPVVPFFAEKSRSIRPSPKDR